MQIIDPNFNSLGFADLLATIEMALNCQLVMKKNVIDVGYSYKRRFLTKTPGAIPLRLARTRALPVLG